MVGLASVVVLENIALIAILFRSRSVVRRRAMCEAPDRPLAIGRPRDDVFGRWWRTALLIPFHPRAMQLQRTCAYGPLERQRLDVWRMSTTAAHAPVILLRPRRCLDLGRQARAGPTHAA